MVKKRWTLLITLAVALLLSGIYLYTPRTLERFEHLLNDQLFWWRGPQRGSDDIVIVDIDERSLEQVGQWPWSRDIMAKLVKRLSEAGAGVIGFDVVFAEPDRSSPTHVLKRLHLPQTHRIHLPDYDQVFARALQDAPVVAGFVFDFERPLPNDPPPESVIYIEHGRSDTAASAMTQARGVIPNIPILQRAVCCSGSFNTVPDDDGVVRSVPLVIRYQGSVYPSLSFEIVRALTGARRVWIEYDEVGVSSIGVGPLSIPTDSSGRLYIDYRGPKGSYRYLSAVDILNGTVDPKSVEGKVVLVGTSAVGLLDLRATPFDSAIPGVEIHANAIDNMLHGPLLKKPSYGVLFTIGGVFVTTLATWLFSMLPSVLLSFEAIVLLMVGVVTGLYQAMFRAGVVLDGIYPLLGIVMLAPILFVVRLIVESRQKELIRARFAKKVSSQVADLLIETKELDLGPQEREVSIFFSDIRGFTTLSEKFASARDLIAFLNRYMAPMSEIIIRNRGTIDKYIGDAIMAYWNAPVETPEHPDLALRSALEQMEALKGLNRALQSEGKMPISIGIGIHTDIATIGEMGSEGRSDFTIIGDSVNLCSRIEGLTKIYGEGIIITEATRRKLRYAYRILELDRVVVKGKEQAVTIYGVEGFGEYDEKERTRIARHDAALKLYRSGRFAEALDAFETLFSETGRALYALYCERCTALMKQDTKIEQFDGVYRYDTK